MEPMIVEGVSEPKVVGYQIQFRVWILGLIPIWRTYWHSIQTSHDSMGIRNEWETQQDAIDYASQYLRGRWRVVPRFA